MNKDLKSLRQLAVPLLLFALCVAVQRSDSAVSAVPVLSFFFLSFCTCNGFCSTRYQHEEPERLTRRRDTTGSHSKPN